MMDFLLLFVVVHCCFVFFFKEGTKFVGLWKGNLDLGGGREGKNMINTHCMEFSKN